MRQNLGNSKSIVAPEKCGHLPSPGRQQQITIVLQSDTSLEEHLQSVPLPVERVDNVGSGLDERGLEHVRQERKDRVEGLVLGLAGFLVGDSSHQFGEDGQIKDQGGGQEGVFTFVEDVLRVSFCNSDWELSLP